MTNSSFNSLSLESGFNRGAGKSTSILNRIKQAYLLWLDIVNHIPKPSRFTLGSRIDKRFLDLLELAYETYYTQKDKKLEKITKCTLILDTLKFLISTSWEAKIISHRQYEQIALKLDEIGKMLGGWKNNLNNPQTKNRTSNYHNN